MVQLLLKYMIRPDADNLMKNRGNVLVREPIGESAFSILPSLLLIYNPNSECEGFSCCDCGPPDFSVCPVLEWDEHADS